MRLWSVQSYRNGALVFEASVPDDTISELALEEVVVRVRPAQDPSDELSVAPVLAAVRPWSASAHDDAVGDWPAAWGLGDDTGAGPSRAICSVAQSYAPDLQTHGESK